MFFSVFFFNDTATTEIYTLSLHDALPISRRIRPVPSSPRCRSRPTWRLEASGYATPDRKSTRLNSSHSQISYAVFCLKKKKHTLEVGISLTQHLPFKGSLEPRERDPGDVL